MSTITLTLPSDTESKLRRKADSAGLSLESFLGKLAEREAEAPSPLVKSFEEIAEPFRRGFEESGMTDEELLALVEEVREDIWQEKQSRAKQQ